MTHGKWHEWYGQVKDGKPWGTGCNVHGSGQKVCETRKNGINHGFEIAVDKGNYSQTEWREHEMSGLKTSQHIDGNIVNLSFADGEEVDGEHVTDRPEKQYFLPIFSVEVDEWESGSNIHTTL